jgi:type IV secretion system protein VirD4
LLLTRIIAGLTGKMEFDNGRAKINHKHRLLLMLDEFPSLGRLDVFESALAFIRGYGIKAYIITQDVQQLYKAYTREESIISNCHIRIAYAPNKLETAEWLSKMAGTATIVKEQITTSGKRFGTVLEQVSTSYQEVQRPLMTPNEIQSMPASNMLVFMAGQPVMYGVKTPYFLDPVFSKRSKIAPPEKSDIVKQAGKSPRFVI